jgi:hypothetical protein
VGCSRIAGCEADESDDDQLESGSNIYIPSGRDDPLGESDSGFDLVSNRIPTFAHCLIERHVHLVHQYIHI